MNYFFVSQRQTHKEEHSQSYLWAPRDGVWHHETMSEVKKGDVIIQYTGKIVGVGIALKDNYNFDRPEANGFNKWDKQGYKVDVEQFHFVTSVEKESVKNALLESQPKYHAPLNVNGGVNQGYLFPANEAMVDIILRKALEIDQSPQQAEIVKKIQETLNIDLSKKGEDEPAQREDEMKKSDSIQKIFFGAPGTGKSFKVNSILPNEDILEVPGEIRKQLFLNSDTAKKAHYADVLDNKEKFGDIWNVDELSALEEKLPEVDSEDNVSNPEHSALQAYIKFLKEYKFERVFRTTFHPDYDYAQFVGAYKPKKEGEKITYSFVPQVFAKAYAAAWKQYFAAGNESTAENQVYLVIEEINRGNCAQIFGDIFQLLDRDGEGFSQYSIDADCDFAEWLKEKGIGDGKLKLPPNLNILATMNTSDQSLFPMDSAFKRRFDWEYVPISFEGKEAANYQIDIDGSQYSWKNFVEAVNDKILDLTESEDKQLGEFFIKPDSGNIISKERFLGKVMFYLWNEVCKDEHKNGSFFRTKDDGYFTFQDLYKQEKNGLLNRFMAELLKDDAQQV
jgi:hypothetical protein